ncbi:phospholipase D family protein [Sinorhizobium psoraleae]|uniref:Phospholipase D family protein n=1 Tax=Sinorhizobium psoraleae TaxID=520838 RepID=A0ABT4K9W0_9HYPH|nr:phospholipase D family protein [Sinorhizobium psoraleae]MCZ4088743.1 phospholipase D family protein [Sinorhizobium psoraleae]
MPADSFFDPDNRQLYTDLLRPPEGYRFEDAIATTYSLDFETALVIPTSIVFRDAENREEMLANPMALLEGVERMAGRLAIYCDRGMIKGARPDAARLMALYENTITEVSAPGGGAFHPKIWCVRFRSDRVDDPVRMRLGVLSRNLTSDRSWDLCLCLDGLVGNTANPSNAPLERLLRKLPELANAATRPPAPGFLPSLLKDLQRCHWELPLGATRVSFSVNGLDRDTWPLPKGERLVIVSPFVSDKALSALRDGFSEESSCHVIARAEELDCLSPEVLERFRIHTLDERAIENDGEDNEARPSVDLEGLHAKAYLVERRQRLQISIGSANATSPALLPQTAHKSNIEVMASLEGPISRMGGIDSVLFSDSFSKLLADYVPSGPPVTDDIRAAERLLEKLRNEIAGLPLELHCRGEGDLIRLTLVPAGRPLPIAFPDDVTCGIRPLTHENTAGFDATSFSRAKARAWNSVNWRSEILPGGLVCGYAMSRPERNCTSPSEPGSSVCPRDGMLQSCAR